MTKEKKENKNNKEKEGGDKDKNLKELEEVKKERDEYLNGWKRARADFANYKKNEGSRLKEARRKEKKKHILEFLEVLDSFRLAEKNMDKEEVDKNYLDGFESIKKQLLNILKSNGVEEIDSVGEKFDPNLHEAVVMIEKEGVDSEEIIEEVRKGYLLDGELLRPAKVKVAK